MEYIQNINFKNINENSNKIQPQLIMLFILI